MGSGWRLTGAFKSPKAINISPTENPAASEAMTPTTLRSGTRTRRGECQAGFRERGKFQAGFRRDQCGNEVESAPWLFKAHQQHLNPLNWSTRSDSRLSPSKATTKFDQISESNCGIQNLD